MRQTHVKSTSSFRFTNGLIVNGYAFSNNLPSTMLSNSEFIVMLNQAASDREKFGRLLNISKEQMSYITNADPGWVFLSQAVFSFMLSSSTSGMDSHATISS